MVVGTDTTSAPNKPLDTETLVRLPIIPFVFLDIGFQAQFDLDSGFNTRGLTDPDLNAIDGFFIVDQPDHDILLRASFSLGVTLDALILLATGLGDIAGNIFLELSDTTDDRVYVDELLAVFSDKPSRSSMPRVRSRRSFRSSSIGCSARSGSGMARASRWTTSALTMAIRAMTRTCRRAVG